MSSLRSKRRAKNKAAREAAEINRVTGAREGVEFQMLTTAIRRLVSAAARLDALLWVSEETERLKEMFPRVARARIVEMIGEEAAIAEVGVWLDGGRLTSGLSSYRPSGRRAARRVCALKEAPRAMGRGQALQFESDGKPA